MKDPRLVEVEFLSALERDRPSSIDSSGWAQRFGVSREFIQTLVISLFADHCLDGSPSIEAPNPSGPYAGNDQSDIRTWTQHSNVQSVKRLLNGNEFQAYVNHSGRLRLWRLRDEILRARRKDAFDLLWDKRHWNADLTMHLAMTDADASTVVLFIDVDDFKAVNEKTSHVVGDEILRIVFKTVMDKISDGGDSYRWGGDEIAALIPRAELQTGKRIAEAIRAEVERQCSAEPSLRGAGLKTTVSIGVGAFKGHPNVDQVTFEVAALMKKVKLGGKNNVVAEELAFTD